jgi:hypothetical protein
MLETRRAIILFQAPWETTSQKAQRHSQMRISLKKMNYPRNTTVSAAESHSHLERNTAKLATLVSQSLTTTVSESEGV